MKERSIWILAEHKDGCVHPVSYELLKRGMTLAERLRGELTAVLLGESFSETECRELIFRGAERVLVVEHPALAHFTAEACSAALVHLVERYRPEILIAAATSTGRTVMPYTAVRLGAGLTADCTELVIEEETGVLLQIRPAIGGNIMATIKTPVARPQMATVRPHSMRPAARDSGRQGMVCRVPIPDDLFAGLRTRWLEFIPDSSQDVAIQDAEIVVAGGRGMGKAEHFGLLHELAGLLHAAVGASRDAVDRGWIGYPHQVGLSGKTVAPRLYLACGISGAVQHIAGMQTAEVIVAINTDPDAQIFKLADLGLVGDVHAILPALIKEIRRMKEGQIA